ncbi:tRNA-binding protein [Handroanthus impetiginosus]|uniref:tRNA-binding protein n=1 Tax=Handroanthus impetiginosus TaxID=429701 RepID=A0A2G9H7B2_9LAMI|nr:tRNA-binding protein [Handroanthus impetiginosus]
MAASTAISGCTTTTHVFFKGTAPFLLSCRRHYRRWCEFLPPTPATSGGLINNQHSSITRVAKFTPLLLPSSPSPVAVSYSSSAIITPAASRRRRRRMQLLCYCTETEAQNTTESPSATAAVTLDGDDDAVRAAANTLDIRVGRIVKAWRHEEADSLYVEEVDVGEPEPRTICSGLVKYMPLHLLQDRNVIVLGNLKPRNMRGVKSFGMLMAASDATHENVELLVPPEGAVPGERVWFGSVDEKENLPDVASPNQVQKKKIWELVQPHLKTDDSRVAKLGIHHMRTSAGVIVSESLKNANIS